MNCRRARELFSSWIDNELKAAAEIDLRRHLDSCSDCAERWASFEATVRMVRNLPPVSPNPSFVGQVLDRVRAYEAGQVILVDGRSRGWLDALRQVWFGFDWRQVWIPARLVSSMAFGLLVGFVLAGRPDWNGPSSARPILTSAAPIGDVPPDHPMVTPDRPLADLVVDSELSGFGTVDSSLGEPPGSFPWDEGTASGRQVDAGISDGPSRIMF